MSDFDPTTDPNFNPANVDWDNPSWSWMLDGDIKLREDGAGVVVEEIDDDAPWALRSARLVFVDGKLYINTCFVDVGDDFPRFLGIMDAASEGMTFIGADDA